MNIFNVIEKPHQQADNKKACTGKNKKEQWLESEDIKPQQSTHPQELPNHADDNHPNKKPGTHTKSIPE